MVSFSFLFFCETWLCYRLQTALASLCRVGLPFAAILLPQLLSAGILGICQQQSQFYTILKNIHTHFNGVCEHNSNNCTFKHCLQFAYCLKSNFIRNVPAFCILSMFHLFIWLGFSLRARPPCHSHSLNTIPFSKTGPWLHVSAESAQSPGPTVVEEQNMLGCKIHAGVIVALSLWGLSSRRGMQRRAVLGSECMDLDGISNAIGEGCRSLVQQICKSECTPHP